MKSLDQTRWLNTPWHHLTRAQMAMRSAPRCVTRQGLQLCKRIFIIVLRLFLMPSTVTFWPSHLVNGKGSMNHFCHCHCYCQFRSPGNFLSIVIFIVILMTVISITGNIEVNVVRCPPTSHPRLKQFFFSCDI